MVAMGHLVNTMCMLMITFSEFTWWPYLGNCACEKEGQMETETNSAYLRTKGIKEDTEMAVLKRVRDCRANEHDSEVVVGALRDGEGNFQIEQNS